MSEEERKTEGRTKSSVIVWAVLSLLAVAALLTLAPKFLHLTITGLPSQARNEIGLFDIVREVRGEIIALQTEMIRNEETPIFQMKTVDVELSFVVNQGASVDVEGGAPKLLIVGADSSYTTEKVQKIHVHMSLVDPGTPDIIIEGIPEDATDAVRLD